MSVSLLKRFDECEAAAMAYLNGEFEYPQNAAMLVGSYTHTAFESAEEFEKFQEENHESIFKKRGGKYAAYEQADKMIETIKNDKFASFAMSGEKEQIFTAELFGAEWKCKVDNVNHQNNFFSDLKTAQDLHKRYWSDKYSGWVSFVERWGYVLQMALYRKIIEQSTGQLYTPYIVAVTKEDIPNKAVIGFDESRFDFEYEWTESQMHLIGELKSGKEPIPCGCCEYCRETKQLDGVIEVDKLINF